MTKCIHWRVNISPTVPWKCWLKIYSDSQSWVCFVLCLAGDSWRECHHWRLWSLKRKIACMSSVSMSCPWMLPKAMLDEVFLLRLITISFVLLPLTWRFLVSGHVIRVGLWTQSQSYVSAWRSKSLINGTLIHGHKGQKNKKIKTLIVTFLSVGDVRFHDCVHRKCTYFQEKKKEILWRRQKRETGWLNITDLSPCVIMN